MTITKFGRRLTGVLLALALMVPATGVFALSPGAQTYASTSNVTETVNFATTFTGLPTNMVFNAGMGGTTQSAPPFTLAFSTNDPAGIIAYAHSNALSDGATHTIPATAFQGAVGTVVGCTLAVGWNPGPKALSGNDDTLCSASAAVASATVPMTMSIVIPPAQTPGVYTGTIIFKVTEQ